MFVLVLAAEADETRQAITFLIVCLVGIAVLLGLLTVWYWMFTSPKRRAERISNDSGPASLLAPPPPSLPPSLEGDAGLAATAMLSDSTELMSSMLADAVEPHRVGVAKESNRREGTGEPHRIEVADRCTSPPRRPAPVPAAPPVPVGGGQEIPAPRPAVTRRLGLGDELANARSRREHKVWSQTNGRSSDRTIERPASKPVRKPPDAPPDSQRTEKQQDGLSDDDWAAVMKSAFDKLNR